MTLSGVPHDLSECDRALIEHLDEHVQSEMEVIGLYETLSNDAHPYVAFVAELIGADEARHHHLFMEWIETIKALAELREAPDGIPHVDYRPVAASTMAMVEKLLEFEEADLAATKALRREIREVRDSTLWGMLTQLLVDDTKKHIMMLKFLHARLSEREVDALA
jgi:hypothetical protein